MSKVLDKYLKLIGLLPRGGSGGGGGGGGDGWAVHTLVDDSSVEFESDPEINPGVFWCYYPSVQLGYKDFLVITVDGDIQASGQCMVGEFGNIIPNGISIPITDGAINVYFDIQESVATFLISYDMENPPTEAPSVSLKVERIGDSSGEQPWVENSGGGMA